MDTPSTDTVLKSFRLRICESVRLVPAGNQRYRVLTPFMFDDGDHLAMVLKREGDRWLLSDEGHTLMRLTYKMDLKALAEGNRARIIENTLGMYGIQDIDGELRTEVEGDEYGGALYSLAQAIIRVSDVSYLSREVVRSTFLEDFRQLMRESAASPSFDWHDDDDPDGHYVVDCYIQAEVPLLIFALANEDKVKDATISILKFETKGKRVRPIGIFQDMEEVSKKAVARLTDVVDKQFSSLESNRDRIKAFIGPLSAA